MATAVISLRAASRRVSFQLVARSQAARLQSTVSPARGRKSRASQSSGSNSTQSLQNESFEITSREREDAWNEMFREATSDKGPLAGSDIDELLMPRKNKSGFENMGVSKKDEEEMEEDPEGEPDDIMGMAHSQLEQIREYRHYARIAAWEMPLLTQLAKDFVPPKANEVLRFRYTSYMGEEHPAEKKVVVEFCPKDMPNLTDNQRLKLKKLVGPRYNPQTDIVKMSCEMFQTPAQNKRYLTDVIDKLLTESRDATDDFADVPLDTRHHTFKTRTPFPKEWKLTRQRRSELAAYRQQVIASEEQKQVQGLLMDGVEQIRESYKKMPVPESQAIPEMAMAGKAKGKGTKRLPMRR